MGSVLNRKLEYHFVATTIQLLCGWKVGSVDTIKPVLYTVHSWTCIADNYNYIPINAALCAVYVCIKR